jgi:hypothetical protein
MLQDFGTEENKTARNGWTPPSNHPAAYLLAHIMFAEETQRYPGNNRDQREKYDGFQ